MTTASSARRRDDFLTAFRRAPSTQISPALGHRTTDPFDCVRNTVGYLSQAFPKSDLHMTDGIGPDGSAIEACIAALYGPAGALPFVHTAELLGPDEDRILRAPTRDFYDLFNRRLLQLAYAAAVRSLPTLAAESARTSSPTRPASFPFRDMLLGILGLHDLENGPHASVTRCLAGLASILRLDRASSWRLHAVLEWYFDTPVRVHQFVGERVPLRPSSCTRLERWSGDEESNACLGVNAVLGTSVLDASHRVDIHLGPMPWKLYQSFQPRTAAEPPAQSTEDAHGDLSALVVSLVGNYLDCGVHLQLQSADWMGSRLGDDDRPPRLSFSAWLADDGKDPAEAVDGASFVLRLGCAVTWNS